MGENVVIKRTAFTLIELILSMVIIGIAFTVLPKILQLATKVSIQNLKEEAMYNAVAYIGLIKSTAWDEANTNYDDILHVTNTNASYDCNSSSSNPIRIGGFTGSRNCKNDQNASSTLGLDTDDTYNDDMDDFDDIEANNTSDSREYNLSVAVNYVQDITPGSANTQFSSQTASPTTNTKEINITIQVNKKASALGNSFVKISFTAMNIGQIQINKRPWK